MKILICDYANVCETDYTLTIQSIRAVLRDAEVIVHHYAGKEDLYRQAADADGMITAFLPLDEAFFAQAKRLKCVSVNAVGYGNIDLAAAQNAGVGICHIAEYCTQEVAEHTFALMNALNRNLKYYTRQVEQLLHWEYHSIPGGSTLSGQTLAIFGFGRIGRRVAALAQAYGMRVLAVDPYVSASDAQNSGAALVTSQEAFARADVITNHMNLTRENYHFFDDRAFGQLKRGPLFINVARGACVDEAALIRALDDGKIRGAGLDVLEAEEPVLAGHPLLNRDNVLITPHSAFYSRQSMERLQTISGSNLAYYLNHEPEKVHRVVSLG